MALRVAIVNHFTFPMIFSDVVKFKARSVDDLSSVARKIAELQKITFSRSVEVTVLYAPNMSRRLLEELEAICNEREWKLRVIEADMVLIHSNVLAIRAPTRKVTSEMWLYIERKDKWPYRALYLCIPMISYFSSHSI